MSARSKSRRHALDLLFEAESRGVNAQVLLDERLETPHRAGRDAHRPSDFTVSLVRGVVAHWAPINDALEQYAQGWTLDRMPAVDRAALRLGTYEVLYCDDIPDAVAISETAEIVTDLSTDDSPTFVRGLLGRIASVKDTLV